MYAAPRREASTTVPSLACAERDGASAGMILQMARPSVDKIAVP
jgi:hypothetical protein